MSGETFGEALGRLRGEKGLSLRQLAKLVPYNHVYLWELETARKRATPAAAALCDRALGANGSLTELAARSASETAATTPEGSLEFPSSWLEGIDNVANLWRHDAGRRRVLRTAAFAASAFAPPVVRWLTATEAEKPLNDGGRPVGMPDVATIREMIGCYRRLDNRYGGGHAREAAVHYLDVEVSPLLRDGRYDGRTATALLSVVAEMTQLVGWMTYDSDLHGLAQRYFIQALRLARAAGDQPLGAEILAAMSHQAVYLGYGATGVDLARSARATAVKAGMPALVAESEVMEAHGHGLSGDERACAAALHSAERTLDRADRTRDPHWIGYFDQAYLSAKFGHCFRALGQGRQAERFAKRSLDMKGGYTRGKAFNLALLGMSYLVRHDPEPERACAVGHEALPMTIELRSARANGYIAELLHHLAPYAGIPAVKQFETAARAALREPAGLAGEEHGLEPDH